MGMVSSVQSYLTLELLTNVLPKKGDFVNLEEKKFTRNIKGIAKGLKSSGFGIVEYSVKSESGSMIGIWAQAHYVLGLPKDLCIISPQGIRTSEGYKGTFIAHCHDEQAGYTRDPH